jgi:signal transduction histidine kinase
MTAHLLAIANEALSNVARHSGATRASVTATSGDDAILTLAITDNGHGFDPLDAAALGHQGLANMRSRVAGIDATMDIASGDAGTSVIVRCPVTADIAGERTESR